MPVTTCPHCLLHAGHLVPLPRVIHLPCQAAGQQDPGHLEDDHHGQRGSDSRNTSLQQEWVAALGHLWKQICGWVWADAGDGRGGHIQVGAEAAGGGHLHIETRL